MADDTCENILSFSNTYWKAGKYSYYSNMFMALDVYDDFLYMNTPDSILVYDARTGESSTFASNNTERTFYGLRVIDGKLYAALADSPNEQAELSYIADCIVRQLPKGDVSGDGAVTIEDITLIQRALAEFVEFTPEQLELADFNNDGAITIRDITAMQRFIAV